MDNWYNNIIYKSKSAFFINHSHYVLLKDIVLKDNKFYYKKLSEYIFVNSIFEILVIQIIYLNSNNIWAVIN